MTATINRIDSDTTIITADDSRESGLTANDIKALRSAETWVCFATERATTSSYGSLRHGRIRAITREHRPEKYGGGSHDTYYDLPVHATITSYDRDLTDYNAYTSATTHISRDIAQSVASVLKPGDILTLDFLASNNNQLMTAAGLYNDECRLKITRESGKQFKTLLFNLDTQCSPNNLARMCRR